MRAKHKKALMRRVHPARAGTVDVAFLGLEGRFAPRKREDVGGFG